MKPSLALIVALVASSAAAPARGNGRFPAATQLLFSPGRPDYLVLRVTFGLLVSSDAGKSWDWICEGAIGYGGSQDPAVAVTAANTLLVGVQAGLATSVDGCDWPFVEGGLKAQSVIVVSYRRSSPLAVVLASTSSGQVGPASFLTRVFASDQTGVAWAPISPELDPSVRVETIDAAESDARRMYISGVRGTGDSAEGVLLVSRDAGQTWSARPIALDTRLERAAYIAAVDPTNANRVYLRTTSGAGGRVLVTDDAGDTVRQIYTARGPLLGFALAPDGATVFVGGPNDGVQAASTRDFRFEARSDLGVQCLTLHESRLWACTGDSTDVALEVSDDGGRTFAPQLCLGNVRGPLACPASSNTSTCVPEWPGLQSLILACDADGGVPGRVDAAVADAAPPPEPLAPHKSGCRAVPGACLAGGAVPALLAGLGLLASALRRCRRRHFLGESVSVSPTNYRCYRRDSTGG